MEDSERVTSAPVTLWDRTRELASREIRETALRLFTEQGYDETTIAQIAREAGVSQRTLFRYFGTKEDLLGGNQDSFRQAVVSTVSKLPAETGVWEALRAGLEAVLALHESRDQALARFRLVYATASLRSSWLGKRLLFQEDLLPLIEIRMDAKVRNKGAKARAMIATAFACLDAASMAWVAKGGENDIMDLYDDCLAAVRG
ncbi:TetR/AcrR family transcriptional regulator [Mycobacterium sp. 21AC1]|uniref:TetR/AcrR family transcriptional regulator n=1 Tax=[Mycobacterium] appelbergii TaxID=2939269 RepID=UPI0029393A46|nr:helix-turn-helix domain-containing protein [Mycobacterium sp. 21AC1]MDV3130312.1 TetR/AcrR family transcriptional regulator [Mycobacterium sp. 21AC1]